MMMLPDKKKMSTLIVAKMGKPGQSEKVVDEKMEGEPMDDHAMAMEDAASKLISAIEKKDAKALAAHIMDMLDMHSMKSESMEDVFESED